MLIFHSIYYSFLSFYKGILAPIAMETPKRAVKFLCFEQYKKVFTFGGSAPIFVVSWNLVVQYHVQASKYFYTIKKKKFNA